MINAAKSKLKLRELVLNIMADDNTNNNSNKRTFEKKNSKFNTNESNIHIQRRHSVVYGCVSVCETQCKSVCVYWKKL